MNNEFISFVPQGLAGGFMTLNNKGAEHFSKLAVQDYIGQEKVLNEEEDTFYYKCGQYNVRATIFLGDKNEWDAVCELVPFAGY